ncbi:ArnT family glycosyltransferase [Salegentibacter sp. HM20]
MPDFTKNDYLWLFLFCGIIFLSHLGELYVNIMEARNFITAREMLAQNNWLLTTLNDLPRYQKPPLPTWLTAMSACVFGLENLFFLRLPAALSAIFLCLIFYRFQVILGVLKRQAFNAALILTSSFYIVFAGRNGQWDIFTHAFMMGAIYFLWKIFQNHSQIYQHALWAGLFFAASLLSKGPVSFYALLLPFVMAYALSYGFKNFGKTWKPFFAFIFTGLLLGGWWFLYVRLADPESFLKISAKEAQNWANYNVRPFYYYWSFFTQSGIWTIPAFTALLYPYLRKRVSDPKLYKFAFWWTMISVILLSIIPEKKSRYLLPVLIPLALTTGFYIEFLFKNYKNLPGRERIGVYLQHSILALIGFAFPFAAIFLLDLEGYWWWYGLTSLSLIIIAAAKLYFLRKHNYPGLFYLTPLYIALIIFFAFPLSNSFLNNPNFKNISHLKQLSEKENFKVYEYPDFTPELIWEYGSSIPLVENLEELKSKSRFGILSTEQDTALIKQQFSDYKLELEQRYDLNYVNPDAGGYKTRLIRHFYLFEKQD